LTTEKLFVSAREDVARLAEILRGLRCTAVMRAMDGIVEAPELSMPVYDAEGRPLALLEINRGELDRSDMADALLRALLESAARAITERWFRLVHRRQWIIAAMRRDAPGMTLLLAIDREHRLAGADRNARLLLEKRGGRFDNQLRLAAFFQVSPTLLPRRRYGDYAVTLTDSDAGQPWVALITPPDTGAAELPQGERAMLHARPRLDSLAHLEAAAPRAREQRGLPHSALKRVEDHIHANLDSPLDIEDLASLVRMSASHFIRSFHKSIGLTPHRYVIQCRIVRARELLATTNLPLTEIALTTGFGDQSHFSRRFHELVGVPPGVFRGHVGGLQP
jgi:AraC-like DNA-binding protein